MQNNKRKLDRLSSILLSLSADFFKAYTDFKPGIITVTGVDVNPDKSYSVIWVATISIDEESFTNQIPTLQKRLRRYISKHQDFRYTPDIKIRIDKSSEDMLKIGKLLQE